MPARGCHRGPPAAVNRGCGFELLPLGAGGGGRQEQTPAGTGTAAPRESPVTSSPWGDTELGNVTLGLFWSHSGTRVSHSPTGTPSVSPLGFWGPEMSRWHQLVTEALRCVHKLPVLCWGGTSVPKARHRCPGHPRVPGGLRAPSAPLPCLAGTWASLCPVPVSPVTACGALFPSASPWAVPPPVASCPHLCPCQCGDPVRVSLSMCPHPQVSLSVCPCPVSPCPHPHMSLFV